MTPPDPDWEKRLADLWAAFDTTAPVDFIAHMQALINELPSDHPVGMFELAGTFDSLGEEAQAEPLYRRALAEGLPGNRRRRAVIQLASTIRNLGRAQESADLLAHEWKATNDDLDDAVVAFLALALIDLGREREAAALTLATLAPHLPRYNRSLSNYAKEVGDRK
ncbi:MAG: tetratricopeptide repeat protein [Alphaproteobacteria bacterium]|nr:tetratricopeptide repeat protein [Alphaproteobacteria bacterium]